MRAIDNFLEMNQIVETVDRPEKLRDINTLRTRDDFGDVDTFSVPLRRKPYEFGKMDVKNDFGMYLGKVGEEWFVGIKQGLDIGRMARVAKIVGYPSLAALKQDWELDTWNF